MWRKSRLSEKEVRNPLSMTTMTASDHGASGPADPRTLSVTMCIISAFRSDLIQTGINITDDPELAVLER